MPKTELRSIDILSPERDERKKRKQDLALAFRLFGQYGFDMGGAGHITARDPVMEGHFWLNPYDVHFSDMRVSDLILVSHDGKVVEGRQKLNQAAFAIHSAIHDARPDIVAAAHAHSPHGKAWSTFGQLLDPLTQDACAFFEKHVLYDHFNGIVLEEDEGSSIAATLGGTNAAILQNHGLLTAGLTVGAAAWRFVAMEDACRIQLAARSAGTPKLIPARVARETALLNAGDDVAEFSFHHLADRILRTQPEVLD